MTIIIIYYIDFFRFKYKILSINNYYKYYFFIFNLKLHNLLNYANNSVLDHKIYFYRS